MADALMNEAVEIQCSFHAEELNVRGNRQEIWKQCKKLVEDDREGRLEMHNC